MCDPLSLVLGPSLTPLQSVLAVKGGALGDDAHGKVNILLQAYISRINVNSFSLISDMNYIAQVRLPPSVLFFSTFPRLTPPRTQVE